VLVGIPQSIILVKETIFLSAFWSALRDKVATKLNISTTFHQQKERGDKHGIGPTIEGLKFEYFKNLG